MALDLSLRRERIKIVEIPNVSPRMAVHYAEKTSRTIVRDVSALVEMGILKVSEEGVEPNREKILAFLPPRRRSNQTAD